jgi:error-prone DNA polymerase
VLSLFPAGHIMERLRPRFHENMCCSRDIDQLKDGAEVMTAGFVIRRQRPLGKVVFITLEDEFGHIPLMVFPQVYERQEHKFKSPFLIVKGTLSRHEGTHNVVVNQVKPFNALEKIPQSKDWR